MALLAVEGVDYNTAKSQPAATGVKPTKQRTSFCRCNSTTISCSILIMISVVGVVLHQQSERWQIDATARPRKATVSHASQPFSIQVGTFLYLVQSRGFPAQKWISRSKWENVSVVVLVWNEDITPLIAEVSSPTFRVLFAPNTTWTTGRNTLYRLGLALEKEQAWKFEFFVFSDEDAVLAYRRQAWPENVIVNRNDDIAFGKLNRLLLRDRPMRAGLGFHPSEDLDDVYSSGNYGCIRKCHMDPILSAYHRTAVDILLPYTEKFDTVSWYASGVISDLFASAVIPSFCHVYQQVLVDLSFQQHKSYPKDMSASPLYNHVSKCLSEARFRDIRRGISEEEFKTKIVDGMGFHGGLHLGNHKRKVGEYECGTFGEGVNFTSKLGSDIVTLWQQYCLRPSS